MESQPIDDCAAEDGDVDIKKAAAEASCWNTTLSTLASCKSGFKIVLIFVLVTYNWVSTGMDRDRQFGLMHELVKAHQLNLTYHHDGLVGNDTEEHFGKIGNPHHSRRKDILKNIKQKSERENKNEMSILDSKHKLMEHDRREAALKERALEAINHKDWRYVSGHEYSEILKGHNGKQKDNVTFLYLSKDLWQCIKECVLCEIGDKTFMLTILFTFVWTHLEQEEETHEPQDDDGYKKQSLTASTMYECKKVEAANNIKERLKKLNMGPLRLYISATLGNLVVSLYSIIN